MYKYDFSIAYAQNVCNEYLCYIQVHHGQRGTNMENIAVIMAELTDGAGSTCSAQLAQIRKDGFVVDVQVRGKSGWHAWSETGLPVDHQTALRLFKKIVADWQGNGYTLA